MLLLSALRHHPVRREKIFEVTSLASRAPHLVGSFLRKIIACGEAAGFEWAFFTATLPLKALLERLGLPLLPLADADRSRVANPDAWGSYYALAPRVYAVHRDGIATCLGEQARAPRSWLSFCVSWVSSRATPATPWRCRTMTMPSRVTTSSPASPVSPRSSARFLPVVGLLGANGIDWATAALAAWTSGKTVVPMPTFFSRLQLEHVLRDAGISHVIATQDAAAVGAASASASRRSRSGAPSRVLFPPREPA